MSHSDRWLNNILYAYWKPLSAIVGLQISYGFLSAILPFYYQQIISLAVSGFRTDLTAQGISIVLVLTGIFTAGALLQALGGYIGCRFSSDLLIQLHNDFFEKICSLPVYYFQQETSGELFTKFNNDIGQAQSFFADFMPSIFREGITTLIVFLLLIILVPPVLTLTVVAIILLNAIIAINLNRILSYYSRLQRESWGNINKVFDETVKGIDTFKVFSGEEQRGRLFRKKSLEFHELSIKSGTIVSVFAPVVEILSKLGGLVFIIIAYTLLSKKEMDTDSFLLFFFYSALLQASISQIISRFSGLQPLWVGVRSLINFFEDTQEETPQRTGNIKKLKNTKIVIRGLNFSYSHVAPIFINAALEIPANSVTVIKGPSGSGKSTLLSILLRLHNFQSGEIRFGEHNINTIPTQQLRKSIGVVTQDHFIINDTLRDNIRIADPDAGDDQILQALHRAHLTEFVSSLPLGLDEVLDHDGKGLSAGEKQRICIARLMLKDASIMILDEPWSNLDYLARNKLVEVINELKTAVTILILTHEIHDTLNVDKQYYLDAEYHCFMQE